MRHSFMATLRRWPGAPGSTWTSDTRREGSVSSRGSWVPTMPVGTRGSTSASGRAGRRLSRRSRPRTASRTRSPPAPRTIARRPWLRRWAEEVAVQEAGFPRLVLSTRSYLAVTGRRAKGDDPGFAWTKRAADRAGNRRLGDRRADPRPGRAHRTADTEAIGLGRDLATTTSCCWTTARGDYGIPTRRRSRRSGSAPAWRGCPPTPSTRGSRWPR